MDQSNNKDTEMSKPEDLVSPENNQSDQSEVLENTSEELKKLQDELAESKDKYLRLYSEFENFRRRTSKEKLEMIHSANEQLITALLPVVDDFERAEKSIVDLSKKEFEGFLLIHSKLKKILDQFGVKVLQIEPGADFNPDTQEAITQIPAPEEKLKGKIIDVVEKGYHLNDKVIRYAKVVVGN
ncbi:MAG TPA: nucleotide exchange factor GrpE [Cyclobacteriaceae bacterium]|nr:nucleotide exchange factor GrpE [Cyclobacteriaceae bacterium]